MPKKVAVGVVTSDKATQTRRVEIERLVGKASRCMASSSDVRRSARFTIKRRRQSGLGDQVEIIEVSAEVEGKSAGNFSAY